MRDTIRSKDEEVLAQDPDSKPDMDDFATTGSGQDFSLLSIKTSLLI